MALTKKFKNNQELIITILIVFGILVVVNFFAYKLFWRTDLTQDKLYTVSNVTKETVKNLPDSVNVSLYYSKELPNQYNLVKQRVIDILSDYRSYSSKFQLQLIDPGDGREAEKLGIPKIQFNQINKDKFEIGTGYMGMVINYRDRKEVIPMIQNTDTFEYQLTSLIKKLTNKESLGVGIVQSHASLIMDNDLKTLNAELSKLYQIETVDLKKKIIPDNVKTLLVVGIKDSFSEDELKVIDSYIMSGKSIIFLVDGINVISSPVNFAIENKTNIFDYLSKFGVKVNKNLIADISSGLATFNQGNMMFNINYPLWPKLIKENFDQKNPIVSQLDSVILPWASSIDIDRTKIDTSTKISELAKTSNKSWVLSGNINLNPTAQMAIPKDLKNYLVAVSLEGKLKSAYGKGETDQGRILVISSSNFIKDDFVSGDPNNLIFIQNLVDASTLDPNLATIRSKSVVARPIKNLSDQEKLSIRYANVFGVTMLLFTYGVLRYYLRNKTKNIEL